MLDFQPMTSEASAREDRTLEAVGLGITGLGVPVTAFLGEWIPTVVLALMAVAFYLQWRKR